MNELPNINNDSKPEPTYSISELESIVYDFVNYNPKNEEDKITNRFKDVKKEDLMKIQRLDKKVVEDQPLP